LHIADLRLARQCIGRLVKNFEAFNSTKEFIVEQDRAVQQPTFWYNQYMKFLLTSAGITNESISKTIADLVGKPSNDISVLFIPTAANTIEGDKGWLIENLNQFKKQRYKSLDILDIAGVPKEVWQPRMEAADLICFGGGNEQYLAKVIYESGIDKALPEILKNRVYMGISAGSMVAGQFLSHNLMKVVYPEEVFEELSKPLAYVNCIFIPHLNSDYFTQVRKGVLEKYKADFNFPLYACDDDSALQIVDGNIEVVSEGECVILNKDNS
jgi:dipeptidase E